MHGRNVTGNGGTLIVSVLLWMGLYFSRGTLIVSVFLWMGLYFSSVYGVGQRRMLAEETHAHPRIHTLVVFLFSHVHSHVVAQGGFRRGCLAR
jgi:hypothetical protein